MLAHRSGHSISPWGLQMGGGNPALDSGFGNSSLSVAARVEARRKRTLKRVNTFVIRRHLLFVPRWTWFFFCKPLLLWSCVTSPLAYRHRQPLPAVGSREDM